MVPKIAYFILLINCCSAKSLHLNCACVRHLSLPRKYQNYASNLFGKKYKYLA